MELKSPYNIICRIGVLQENNTFSFVIIPSVHASSSSELFKIRWVRVLQIA